MKNLLLILALALCAFAGTTFADDFKSVTIPGGTSLDPIRVHGDQFMVIRNFTQETTGTMRGVVMVTQLPVTTSVNVLAAAILDPMNNTQGSAEVINSVVIAGPADVTVTCGAPTGMNCFVSYKKDSN